MTREVQEVLVELEGKVMFWPLDRESDDVEVDGVKFSHQDLMVDIF